MEYVEPLVCLANCFGTPVCKYLRYHRKLKVYVRNFKMIRDELTSKMQDIELQLKAELFHPAGKVPKKAVENWLQKAKEMIRETEDVENEVGKGRYLCRACNGKMIDEKTQELQKFIDKAPNASESLVIDGPSAGLPLPTSELVGAKAVRDEIWECLMHEDVSKIGVWGMGGVGKTTIMKHIHNDLLNQRQRFERVVWVTISKDFNLVKLQDNIARAFKINYLSKEGDKLGRAAILSKMLKKVGKYVLVLDDVWDKVSLEEVGIPEPSSSNGCKLVLTTRYEQVCNYIDCKVIKVKPLSEEEALILFLNRVGPNIVQSPALMPTLRLVVKECAGLPLTIVVLAGTLKGENEARIWRNALKELKERIGKVEGVEAEVIERLKFSFDHLKDGKVKQCFLYCALYPEDFEIRKDELIECWIDEGLVDEMDTREEMKDKGHAILKKLEENCLLENECKYGRSVKMHDAVRDMALSVTSINPLYTVRAGLQLEEFPKEEEWMTDVEKVSLMKNSMSEIPMDTLPPKRQLLKTLLLQQNYNLRMIPDSFFANMPCLSILNLSSTKIERLPNSISELRKLTTLLLGHCFELRYLPCLSKLEGLKKLDLCGTKIEQVPEGMDMLINLTYLDLGVFTLKEIPVGVMPKLSRLQDLRFCLYNEELSLMAEEVVPLMKLELFEGRFKDVHEFNKFVSSMQKQSKKNIIKYHLKVGLTERHLIKKYRVHSAKFHSSFEILDKLLSINEVKFCEGDELIMLLNDVQQLEMFNCHGMEYVVSFSSASYSTHPFPGLKVLNLFNLPELVELVKVEGLAPSSTFSHLKRILMMDCMSMKTFLPQWLIPNLQNLEVIEVYACKNLVEIFGAATTLEHEERELTDALIKFNLPKLAELRLEGLPELERICSKRGAMVCDSLRLIDVYRCGKLKRFPPFVGNENEQPYAYAPPSLKIKSSTKWWDSLEWDDLNFKNILQPHRREW